MGNKTRHTANLVSDNNLFVDIANDRVGIGSTQPTAKLNVAGIVSATSFIGDGSQLSGVTVTGNASLQQLTVSGNITANGNIVGDNSTNITGISGVTASTLTGTLQTAAQTNITSVGTLGSLTVSGNITANGNIVGDNATNISGVNQVTATTFSGSGASLTGLTGASAATYGGASVSPQITVDANGRITSITNVSIAGGGGGGGTSIIVQDSQSLVGAAGTIDFGTGLSVSAISAGVGTVTGITTSDVRTSTLSVSGVSTFTTDKVFFKNGGTPLPATLQIETGVAGIGNTIRSSNTLDLVTNGSAFKLKLDTTNAIIAGGTGAAQYVQLYGTGSEKLKTIGTGVTVTGTTFSNQLSVSGVCTAAAFSGITTSMISDYGGGLGGGDSFPSGGIILWSGAANAIPTGWVLCDGQNSTPDLRNRFVVGAGDSYAVDATGGSADAIVVSHTHGSGNLQTNNTGGHSHGGNTNDSGNHTHGGGNYITNTTGSHQHRWGTDDNDGAGGTGNPDANGGQSWKAFTDSQGDHYHNVNGNSQSEGNHSHNINTNNDGSHQHNMNGDTGSQGSSGTGANLPPYYALCYIMKS